TAHDQPCHRIPLGQHDCRQPELQRWRYRAGGGRQLLNVCGLRAEPGNTRLHAVIHAFRRDRRRLGNETRLRTRIETPLLGATIGIAEAQQTAYLAVPRPYWQATDHRPVIRAGATLALGTDRTFV